MTGYLIELATDEFAAARSINWFCMGAISLLDARPQGNSIFGPSSVEMEAVAFLWRAFQISELLQSVSNLKNCLFAVCVNRRLHGGYIRQKGI
jgi:hypothetical protein